MLSLNTPLRVGVGGPVGSGKTALIEFCKSNGQRLGILIASAMSPPSSWASARRAGRPMVMLDAETARRFVEAPTFSSAGVSPTRRLV
jgi:hypothetical protein